MTEGLLGGVLAGEGEKTAADVAEAPAGAEAFAAAVTARLSANDPGVARKTEEFLTEQTQLLRVQKEHLKDERAARLQYLRGQAREVDIRRFGLLLRVGFQFFIALVAGLLALGAVIMIYDAFHSRSVVIEPFNSPPTAAARGLTGQVVASKVLDELVRLQATTHYRDNLRPATNAWSGEIKLALPEAGISLGEISTLLKARFGHDLHINGDLVLRDDEGFTLTVRGDGVLPKTFAGLAHDIDAQAAQAAEYIYAESQPGDYAYYLTNVARFDEAIAFARDKIPGADPLLRSILLNSWAIALNYEGGANKQAESLFRAALKLNPEAWHEYLNISDLQVQDGDEEGAWHTLEEFRRAAGGRPGRSKPIYHIWWHWLTRDYTSVVKILEADIASNGIGVFTDAAQEGLWIAYAQVALHNRAAAELALQTVKPNGKNAAVMAMTHLVLGRLAADAGDTKRASAEIGAFASAVTTSSVAANIAASYPGFRCWIAPALEAAGQPDQADAALVGGGRYVDCYRFRGDILDRRGDWLGAQRAYADAVALAPDLPAAYYSWGVALARHGEPTAAEAKIKDANLHGPHWADPLQAWGDVLAKQGKIREALSKYDEALKYAPNWRALEEARDALARKNN
jgi:tetratricopeptide (TPR) repeat protein